MASLLDGFSARLSKLPFRRSAILLVSVTVLWILAMALVTVSASRHGGRRHPVYHTDTHVQKEDLLMAHHGSDDRLPVMLCVNGVCAEQTDTGAHHLRPPPQTSSSSSSPPAPADKGPQHHVAYCFAGGMRTMPQVWESTFKGVVEALQPDPKLRTAFFRVDTDGHCRANAANVAHHRGFVEECEDTARKARDEKDAMFNSQAFRDAFPDARIMSPELSCNNDPFQQHPCCTNPNAGGFTDKYAGFTQYARKLQCIDDMRRYSAETGVNFSYAVILRPDLHFFEPVPPVEHWMRLSPRLVAPSKEGTSMGDYFFMFPWSIQSQVFDAFVDTFGNRCRHPHAPSPEAFPEYIFADILERSNTLAFQVYPFNYAVVRSKTKADCPRLDNQFVGKGRFVVYTDPPEQQRQQKGGDGQQHHHVVPPAPNAPRVMTLVEYCKSIYPQEIVLV